GVAGGVPLAAVAGVGAWRRLQRGALARGVGGGPHSRGSGPAVRSGCESSPTIAITSSAAIAVPSETVVVPELELPNALRSDSESIEATTSTDRISTGRTIPTTQIMNGFQWRR